MEALLGIIPGDHSEVQMAQTIATLPMRMEGLDMRSAARVAPAALGVVG